MDKSDSSCGTCGKSSSKSTEFAKELTPKTEKEKNPAKKATAS